MGLFGFGKKEVKKAEVKKVDVKGAYIKVLGSGCCKCNDMGGSVMEALELLGKEPVVEHVNDFAKIAEYGVMATPALVLGDRVVSSGRVLKVEEIVEILKKDEER